MAAGCMGAWVQRCRAYGCMAARCMGGRGAGCTGGRGAGCTGAEVQGADVQKCTTQQCRVRGAGCRVYCAGCRGPWLQRYWLCSTRCRSEGAEVLGVQYKVQGAQCRGAEVHGVAPQSCTVQRCRSAGCRDARCRGAGCRATAVPALPWPSRCVCRAGASPTRAPGTSIGLFLVLPDVGAEMGLLPALSCLLS